MSHSLDIDGVLEKLILLQHFTHGSRTYCSLRMAGSKEDPGDGALDEYWGWVKAIVSNYTVECAIKFRILEDTIRGHEGLLELARLDSRVCDALTIGQVVEGHFDLDLRETCNKIVHARKAMPLWSISSSKRSRFKYWTGIFELSGTRNAEKWILRLDIGKWAQAMEAFIKQFESSDAFNYLGQDWY